MPAALSQPLGWSTPLTATQHPFSLFINGTDVVGLADIDGYRLDDPGGTQPATLEVVLIDRANAVGPTLALRQRVRWVDNVAGRTLFDGFIRLIEPTLVATYGQWRVSATSVDAILDGLYIVSAARPAESASARIASLLATCEPTAASLAFGAGGHQGVTTALDAATYVNQTVRAAIESVLAAAADGPYGYYIDPSDWSLHTYTGTATGATAPYAISDAPDGVTSVPAVISLQRDGSQSVDAVYVRGGTTAGSGTVWGAAAPQSPALVAAIDDSASRDATMLAAIGSSELAFRGQSEDRLSLVVTGYDGWAVGQVVSVTNATMGWSAAPYVISGVSMRMRSGTGVREYTLSLGRGGPLRLSSHAAVTRGVAATKVTGAQLAAGTVLSLSIGGTCTFDSGDSGYIYFAVPNLGNGFTVVAAQINTHFRQFWAPATGTASTTSAATTPGSVTSAATTPGSVTSAGGSSHSHTTPNHSHLLAAGGAGAPASIIANAQFYNSGGSLSGPFVGTSVQADLYSSAAGGGSTSGSEASHTHSVGGSSHSHSVGGSSHSHSVPAAGLAYGMFLESLPASWNVTIALEFYSGSWGAVATYSGISALNDLARDISAAITQAGEYRLNLSSAGGQPNGGRLVADVSGIVAIKLL